MSLIKKKYKFNYFEPLIIIAFWALLFASPLLFGRFEDQIEWQKVQTAWLNFLPLLVLFFINRFALLPRLFFKGKRVGYFLSTISIIVLFAVNIHFFNDIPTQKRPRPEGIENSGLLTEPPRGFDRMPPPNIRPSESAPQPIPPSINFLILAVLLVGFDTGLQISMRWSSLEKEKFKLEKESVENQLAILKNQVSPHFFMNTLNNIHALVDIDSEQAKTSIIKLSNLMRYLLYDSEGSKTPIKKEISFIESYIELMKLRFSEKVKITVDIPTVIPEKLIPPLLFTSLIENAFKHGISYNSTSFIEVKMSFSEENLIFIIKNSNPNFNKTNETKGIGIENTKKRLDLIYGENYTLKVDDNKEFYLINLNVPL